MVSPKEQETEGAFRGHGDTALSNDEQDTAPWSDVRRYYTAINEVVLSCREGDGTMSEYSHYGDAQISDIFHNH